MSNDSPLKAVLVVFIVVLVASSLVSAAVVLLRPMQLNNELLDRSRNVLHLTGLLAPESGSSDEEMLALYKILDIRIIDIDSGSFDPAIDPYGFDQLQAVNEPGRSVEIPLDLDSARLGRRSRFAAVYLVWGDADLDRLILPIHGSGMWSTLYGYVALESDLNTIADATFYQQNETPGLGDQVASPNWLAQWRGRKIRDEAGEVRFAVADGRVEQGSLSSTYEVDALTGATVTADAVTNMVRYWFGPHGYRDFLEQLKDRPLIKPVASGER